MAKKKKDSGVLQVQILNGKFQPFKWWLGTDGKLLQFVLLLIALAIAFQALGINGGVFHSLFCG